MLWPLYLKLIKVDLKVDLPQAKTYNKSSTRLEVNLLVYITYCVLFNIDSHPLRTQIRSP